MVKIKCPVCNADSYYKTTSIDIIRLTAGEIVTLQCGDEVRALGRPSEPDPDAPYVEIQVFGVQGE